MTCSNCAAELRTHHTLVSTAVSRLSNGSDIIEPACQVCGRNIEVADVAGAITPAQHVMLVSGTAGAGKSAIGQHIAQHYRYVLIDGDAISRKENHRARVDPTYTREEYLCHTEVIRTVLAVLGLGYHVVVAHVIQLPDVSRYASALQMHHVPYDLRVLIPSRDVCLQRDHHRPCWTAGAEYVDLWHDEFQSMRQSHSELCIDSSEETLEETVAKHLHPLLRMPEHRQ